MAITLTPRGVAALKPHPRRRVELGDTVVPGLVLRVTPAGVKSYALRYKHRGRDRRLTLGSTKVLSLATARERARDELVKVGAGSDPALVKQQARQADTIGELATLYLEKWAKPRKRSWKADDNLLRRKILPAWRHRAIVEIRRADVRALVDDVATAGAPIVANRVAALLSKLFAFALDRELVEHSPAIRIPRPGKEQARDRVLRDDEIRAFWTTVDAMDAPMAAFYKLRLLTAQRGGEVTAMRWRDVDLAAGWWTIPATASKNGLAHRVPLGATAIALVTALKAAADARAAAAAAKADAADDEDEDDANERATYVLAGARGKRQQAEAAATLGLENFRGHDLRRTAASYMASGGIARLVISKILNHREPGVTRVYDRHSYDAEKSAALTWWDVRLAAIVAAKDDDKAGATVVPFARA